MASKKIVAPVRPTLSPAEQRAHDLRYAEMNLVRVYKNYDEQLENAATTLRGFADDLLKNYNSKRMQGEHASRPAEVGAWALNHIPQAIPNCRLDMISRYAADVEVAQAELERCLKAVEQDAPKV